MELIKKLTAGVFFTITVASVASIILALPVQLLWNNVLVDVIDVNPITFWQALGIYLLAMLLFKNSNNIEKK